LLERLVSEHVQAPQRIKAGESLRITISGLSTVAVSIESDFKQACWEHVMEASTSVDLGEVKESGEARLSFTLSFPKPRDNEREFYFDILTRVFVAPDAGSAGSFLVLVGPWSLVSEGVRKSAKAPPQNFMAQGPVPPDGVEAGGLVDRLLKVDAETIARAVARTDWNRYFRDRIVGITGTVTVCGLVFLPPAGSAAAPVCVGRCVDQGKDLVFLYLESLLLEVVERKLMTREEAEAARALLYVADGAIDIVRLKASLERSPDKARKQVELACFLTEKALSAIASQVEDPSLTLAFSMVGDLVGKTCGYLVLGAPKTPR
jgi:hypothetical protein